MRGGPGAVLVVPAVAVCWLAPAVLSAWGIFALRDHGLAPAAAVGFGVIVLGWLVGVVRLLKNDAGRTAVALFCLLAAWIILVVSGLNVQDQRLLHERGVVSDGEVVRTTVTSDPMAGQGPAVTAVDVRLADGTTVRGIGTRGDHPALGDRLRVTVDPRGTVAPRLGPRPDAVDWTVPVLLLVVMAGCALVAGAAVDEL
ncbi:hypothetical protein [Kitasatospora sp. NPDC091207]|uniref:hypothetical protein n=1 Tax=Kitasatospora sp. NPDC091207 TaxID=3364083 RepID=UPI00382D96E0